MSPLCESYLRADQLNQMEPFYPLWVFVCENCFLVQLQEYVRPDQISLHRFLEMMIGQDGQLVCIEIAAGTRGFRNAAGVYGVCDFAELRRNRVRKGK